MSLKVRMTSKRQVTFPAAVCEALAVYPGDTLVLQNAELQGKQVWVIEAQRPAPSFPWMGALRSFAASKSPHDMSDVRATIARKCGGHA